MARFSNLVGKFPMKEIVLPSGRVIADSWTLLFTVTIVSGTKALSERSAMWPPKLSAVDSPELSRPPLVGGFVPIAARRIIGQ